MACQPLSTGGPAAVVAGQVRDVLRAACYASPAEPAHATRERMAAGQVVLVLEPAFNADSQETP